MVQAGVLYKQLRDVLCKVLHRSDIWIAAGTYKLSATNTKPLILPLPNLRIFGGFTGMKLLQIKRTRLQANETILSGDYSGNDGAILPIDFFDNAYHVFVITDSNVTMDGLTIKGGNARVASSDQDSGGGTRAQTNTILNINNCLRSRPAFMEVIATFTGTKLNFSNSIFRITTTDSMVGAGLSLRGSS